MDLLLETGALSVLNDDGLRQAYLRHSGLLSEKLDEANDPDRCMKQAA